MVSKGYPISHLAKACQAEFTGAKDSEIAYLLTDSRRLIFPRETLFFALSTASNDGHRYIPTLYQKGVRAFVVNQDFDTTPFDDATFLVVDDVLRALQQIAGKHRSHFHYPVVAVTGSNGKTIVKEWLFQLVQEDKRVVRSPRSYNSQIGVPLSLWQFNERHQVAIIEAGISQVGEMQHLAKIIQPTIGIFTNLGHAHDAGFEDKSEKAREKASLFKGCEAVIYCTDQPEVEEAMADLKKHHGVRLLPWTMDAERRDALLVETNATGFSFTSEGQTHAFELSTRDAGSLQNAIHATLCALELGVSISALKSRVALLRPVEMRLEERRAAQGNLLINDFYNSDPESVRIALDLLCQQPKERQKIAIISEFEGLPESEKDGIYRQLIEVINGMPIQLVIVVGSDWISYNAGIVHERLHFNSTERLMGHLAENPYSNSAILLKGARRFKFERIAERLQEQVHQTWLEVNLSALSSNLRYYKGFLGPKVKLMSMVKAFSYGAGTTEIARHLQYNRVDYLAVAYLDEGVTLRKGGITIPIMVMNPDPEAFERLIAYQLEPELFSLTILKEFVEVVRNQYAGEADYPIHLKVETGMNRLGIEAHEVPEAIEILNKAESIRVASVFSHLAASDAPEHDDFTDLQIERFEKLTAQLEEGLGYQMIKHLANTSGVARFKAAQQDMVRLGIGLYGAANSEKERQNLKTVMRWYTRVSQVKTIAKGSSVGYGLTYVAAENHTSATLPVGYADGFFRSLSNGVGQVFFKGKKVPIIGRVCMDMLMVDVTGLDVEEGDVVEIMGDHITVQEMAEAANTIPYEIFTHISSRVPRVYITE